MDRCPWCNGNLLVMDRLNADSSAVDQVRACLLCGREDTPPPPPDPVRRGATTWMRRSH